MIKTDTGVSITQRTNLFRCEFDVLPHTVDNNKVVAETMHFGEFYFHNLWHCALISPGKKGHIGKVTLADDANPLFDHACNHYDQGYDGQIDQCRKEVRLEKLEIRRG